MDLFDKRNNNVSPKLLPFKKYKKKNEKENILDHFQLVLCLQFYRHKKMF